MSISTLVYFCTSLFVLPAITTSVLTLKDATRSKRQTTKLSRMPLYFGKRSSVDLLSPYEITPESLKQYASSRLLTEHRLSDSGLKVSPGTETKVKLLQLYPYLKHILPHVSPSLKDAIHAQSAIENAIVSAADLENYGRNFAGEKRKHNSWKRFPQFHGKRTPVELQGDSNGPESERNSEEYQGDGTARLSPVLLASIGSENHVNSLVDRMPEFYGKRSTPLFDIHTGVTSNKLDNQIRQDGQLVNVNEHVQELYNEPSNLNSDMNLESTEDNDAILLESRAANVVDRMPRYFGKRSQLNLNTAEDVRAISMKERRNVVDRMPPWFGKRSGFISFGDDTKAKTDDDVDTREREMMKSVPSYHVGRPGFKFDPEVMESVFKKRGIVDRMPAFYGKRSELNLNNAHGAMMSLRGVRRNSGVKSILKNFVLGNNIESRGGVLKRNVVSRMPSYFGKRSETPLSPLMSESTKSSDIWSRRIAQLSGILRLMFATRLPESRQDTLSNEMRAHRIGQNSDSENLNEKAVILQDSNDKIHTFEKKLKDGIYSEVPFSDTQLDAINAKQQLTKLDRMPYYYGKRSGTDTTGTKDAFNFNELFVNLPQQRQDSSLSSKTRPSISPGDTTAFENAWPGDDFEQSSLELSRKPNMMSLNKELDNDEGHMPLANIDLVPSEREDEHNFSNLLSEIEV